MDAEYFLRGETYKANIVRGRRVGITFLALNESVYPLNDVRVRRALQLALDREVLLKASIGGRGDVEHGMFPLGLVGHNEALSPIPFDPKEARNLFDEAGVEEGTELEICYPLSASQSLRDMLDLVASMWRDLGMRVFVVGLSAEEFEAKRDAGELACYPATYSAEFDDPQSVIRPFFGSVQNSRARSLCYDNKEIIERVQRADAIVDEQARIAEYQALEQKIVQEDAAWIPVYSRLHYFVVSDRVNGFRVGWNGWSSIRYDNVSLTLAGE
jgi:ABC-type transport system substrate-binding protein